MKNLEEKRDVNLYLDIIYQFLASKIDAVTFDGLFRKRRNDDLDELYAQRSQWERRYDFELTEQLRQGKISAEEFSKHYFILHGLDTEEKIAFDEMVNAIFSKCCSFEPDDHIRDESMCNEIELRDYVSKDLVVYERALKGIKERHANQNRTRRANQGTERAKK